MKTRFCPSPTGLMHWGNVRTALFNKLMAYGQAGGCFLLRLEDTDKQRSSSDYSTQLKNDLRWLELNWDEGPDCEQGSLGPYEQSNRQTIYDHYYTLLEEKGLAYPCFCSEAELATARKRLLRLGQPPRYLGTCRLLSPEHIQEKKAQGLQSVLRFRVPDHTPFKFVDFVKGEQQAPSDSIGDFIIRRADGSATFLFCNALDDALMKVTHVLRGEDHLANTFRQIMLLQALDLSIPEYGHIALILGEDGAPLSKRNGSESIEALRQQGFHPLALINYMARLGHRVPCDDLLSLNELSPHFFVEHLSLAPARFDKKQLLYWQKQALLSLSDDAFWEWVGTAVHSKIDAVDMNERRQFVALIRDNVLFPPEAENWASVFYDKAPVCHKEEALTYSVLAEAGASFFHEAYTPLKRTLHIRYKDWIDEVKSRTGCKGHTLFLPLRVAITGKAEGPSLEAIFELLRRDSLHWVGWRMQQAIDLLSYEETDPSTKRVMTP